MGLPQVLPMFHTLPDKLVVNYQMLMVSLDFLLSKKIDGPNNITLT